MSTKLLEIWYRPSAFKNASEACPEVDAMPPILLMMVGITITDEHRRVTNYLY